jgi:hypothetical protein
LRTSLDYRSAMGIFGSGKLNRGQQVPYIPPANVHPLCPHCEHRIDGVFTQQIKMGLGKTWVYFCRTCHKVLGVSQRKGFWMG